MTLVELGQILQLHIVLDTHLHRYQMTPEEILSIDMQKILKNPDSINHLCSLERKNEILQIDSAQLRCKGHCRR